MARSRSIGSIYAELTLKDGDFRKKLTSAGKAAAAFGKRAAVTGTAALTAGLAASGVALTAGTLKTLDQVDALGDMSAQTGIAVADLMKLQRAYEDGGRAANMAGADIAKMQKNLVTAAGGGNDPFAQLGLSAKELLTLDPAAQFSKIGAAIMRIENPAQRTAAAMDVFGKGGRGLLTVFEGLPAAERSLGRMPEIAQKFAGSMGEANDLIGRLPVKADQFFMGFTSGIVKDLIPALKRLEAHDMTAMGESWGKNTAGMIRMLGDMTSAVDKLDKRMQKLNGNSFSLLDLTGFGLAGRLMEKPLDMLGERLSDAGYFSSTGGEALPAPPYVFDGEQWRKIDEAANAVTKAADKMESPPAPSLPPIAVPQHAETPYYVTPLPDRGGTDFVNEYQKRGLSLSGGVGSQAEETTKSIENMVGDIRRRLEQMADQFSPSTW